ncbi:hypothetical protein BNJ_00184 [Kaumoebavirus]|uniref:hypothetical protein n=1 Tax=Kaumoebavirus TaxID=1859492 RepID=UPI0009C21BE7|nr:hypothetical protein BNJ_00184 [Kaumoebavirus]ARA72015.1 hypothetical protein BNJ_00184 [Kaumoebavirus]
MSKKRPDKNPTLEAYDPGENATFQIPHMQKTSNEILHKTNVFYGLSGNGKSTLNIELMTWMKQDTPLVIVFSNSEESNEIYSKVVPPYLIFTELKREKLQHIWDRQQMASKIWKQCQNIQVLASLFQRFASSHDKDEVKACEQAKSEVAKKLKAIYEADPSKKSEISIQIEKLESKHGEMLRARYKEIIRRERRNIIKNAASDTEREIATYLDFNPNLLLIIDDFSAELKSIMSDKRANDKNPIVHNMFYKGRHCKVTAFLNFQSDKDLLTELRMNAHNSFFCSSQSANSFFNKGNSTGFSNEQKKKATNAAKAVFTPKPGDDRTQYRKLVYLRMSNPQFQYVIADFHHGFRMGSQSLWDYAEKLSKYAEKNIMNTNNEFAKMFKI